MSPPDQYLAMFAMAVLCVAVAVFWITREGRGGVDHGAVDVRDYVGLRSSGRVAHPVVQKKRSSLAIQHRVARLAQRLYCGSGDHRPALLFHHLVETIRQLGDLVFDRQADQVDWILGHQSTSPSMIPKTAVTATSASVT